jgi:beta-galactosidase
MNKKKDPRKIAKYSGLLLLFLCNILHAQKQYQIDISKQQAALVTGFIKTGTNTSPAGEKLSYNNSFLTRNDKPWYPIFGEMHYSRTDEKEWEESILKMKSGGIDVLSTYVIWNLHEETENAFEWSGNKDLQKFLTLCQKHKMKVWLRIGPWSHAEIRYGGFPDWLINKKIGLRKNDPNYLNYSKKLYETIATQCQNHLFKNGGPVIGIQIENELQFKNPEAYLHMKTLKQLAVEAGLDVPYYSAFAQGPEDQDEFLYTLGAYPDSPWAQHTNKMYKPMFSISSLENDSDIGSDLFGQIDTKLRNSYPKLGAELGGGMQVTYHRRVHVSEKDIAGVAHSRIASGLNGLGYYMYHGGMNPVGKTTFQESRLTEYPNDVSIINYDFQAPIGAMGLTSKSYKELRLLHTFLKDFGSEFCTQTPFFPTKKQTSLFSMDTVKNSIRIKDNSGFIFLSNYQRHLDLPAVRNFQLQIANQGKVTVVPEKPTTYPANSYCIWPYNLQMDTAVLKYATAQLLCKLENENSNSFVFFSDEAAEFVFKKATIASITAGKNCTVIKNTNSFTVNCSKNSLSKFVITNPNGKKTEVLLLPRQTALRAVKIDAGNKQSLLLCDADIMIEQNKILLDKINSDPHLQISVYPDIKLQPLSNLFTVKLQKGNGLFIDYLIESKNKFEMASVHLEEDTTSLKTEAILNDAKHFQDSTLLNYAKSPRFDKKQPGPIYQYKFHNLPDQKLYNLKFVLPQNPLIKDWVASLDYHGDVMALYKNDTLVYDQFNYNNNCRIKMSTFNLQSNDNLTVQILPFKPEYDIYVEDNMLDEKKALNTTLKAVMLSPIFRYELKMITNQKK